ncbi:MAG: transcriptional regulator Spx [Bacilli bacterium]
MITIYTSPSCSSCRKVKEWFVEQQIPFKEKNIFTSVLNADELKKILILCDNGTDDIISKRSNIIKAGNVDIDEMKISELIQYIIKNPSILKRPIIVDDNRIQVGYNKFDISSFVPAARKYAKRICPHDGNCEECDCGKKLS